MAKKTKTVKRVAKKVKRSKKQLSKKVISRLIKKRLIIIPYSEHVTWEEKKLVIPLIVKRIRQAQRQKQQITNPHLCASLLKHNGIKVNAPIVRKLIHYIRINGIIKRLIAGKNGYFVSNNAKQISVYLKRLAKMMREIGKFKQAICDQSANIMAKSPHLKNCK